MKKLLLSLVILSGLNVNSQTILFEDSFDFETDFAIANVGDWTLLDVDLGLTYGFTGVTFLNTGVAKSFQVFNATATTPPLTPSATANWSARTGDRHMVCFASSQPSAAPLNNDWLISPQITLGTGNVLKFWAKACDATYFAERFSVWVSTTGTAPANFTKISTGAYLTTPNITWAEYTYNLAATYNNLPVYIGIKCTSPDMFGFAVDDFSVTGTVLATDTFFSENFKVYPNPATNVVNVVAKSGTTINQVEVTDINGRVVKAVTPKALTSEINISELTSGVYFVKVASDLGSGTTKIVKQ
jgi:Secretion system C-terminal sorting domain/Cleaved Adhesin Domain